MTHYNMISYLNELLKFLFANASNVCSVWEAEIQNVIAINIQIRNLYGIFNENNFTINSLRVAYQIQKQLTDPE